MTVAQEPFFFTWSAQRQAKRYAVKSVRGAELTLDGGQVVLDLGAASFQAALGYEHPRMTAALERQARTLSVSMPSFVFDGKRELAKTLLELAPEGFEKVFFTLGGAEATENAMKIARLATGRYKAVSRYRSYHGATLGAATLSGDWRRPPVEPGIIGVVHVMDLDGPRRTEAPLSDIPRVLELEGNVGCVVLEPVVGANGVLIPPQGYFREIREACDRHGALLVVDEVLTGFGRTGKWFAFEHFDGVVPDLITCGKALTAGFAPLGAVLVHGRVAARFDDSVLVAGLTNYGHPLGIAAAVEALAIYRDEELIPRADAVGERMQKLLLDPLKEIGTSRRIGALSATELPLDGEGFARLGKELSKRGIMVHLQPRVGAAIVSPPLNIPFEQLDRGLSAVVDAIRHTLRDVALEREGDAAKAEKEGVK